MSAELEEDIKTMGLRTSFRDVAALVGMVPGNTRDDLVERLARNPLTRCLSNCLSDNDGCGNHREIALASHWTELKARAALLNPQTIVFDDSILPADTSLEEAARRMALFAPVIVIAPPGKAVATYRSAQCGRNRFRRSLRRIPFADWSFRRAPSAPATSYRA